MALRILVDVGHPGHVHFYKHAIWRWQEAGHQVLVSAREKDVTLELLNHLGFDYVTLSSAKSGFRSMIGEFARREYALLGLIRQFKPDVVTEIGGAFVAPVGRLLDKPTVVFTDSEPVTTDRFLVYPFAKLICTPDCFMLDLGRKQRRYAGYHELAYLHPDYYKPDPNVLAELGVEEGEPYIVLRFVAWKAGHDIGQSGFSLENKRRIVSELSRYGRVFISSEGTLPSELSEYGINLPAYKIHDVLYYAQLFMGDGATMATEAALLGTPSVRASTLALNMGNFVELMDRYELVYSYYDVDTALEKAKELLQLENSKREWQRRLTAVFADKIDVTAYVCEMVESASNFKGRGEMPEKPV